MQQTLTFQHNSPHFPFFFHQPLKSKKLLIKTILLITQNPHDLTLLWHAWYLENEAFWIIYYFVRHATKPSNSTTTLTSLPPLSSPHPNFKKTFNQNHPPHSFKSFGQASLWPSQDLENEAFQNIYSFLRHATKNHLHPATQFTSLPHLPSPHPNFKRFLIRIILPININPSDHTLLWPSQN